MTPPLDSHTYKFSRKICFIHFESMSIGSYCRTLHTLCLTENSDIQRISPIKSKWNKCIYRIICIFTFLIIQLIVHYRMHIYNSNWHLCNTFWSCRCTEHLPAGRFTFVPGGATYRHNLQQDSQSGVRHSWKPWVPRGPWKESMAIHTGLSTKSNFPGV